MTPFSSALITFRRRQKLSQTELARRLRVAHQYIGKLESGEKAVPNGDRISEIATALELNQADRDFLTTSARDSNVRPKIDLDAPAQVIEVINRLIRVSLSLQGPDVVVLQQVVERCEKTHEL